MDSDSDPETDIYSDTNPTDSDEFLNDIEPGLAQDWGLTRRQLLNDEFRSFPNVHRGPQQNALHVTFNKIDGPSFKLQIPYSRLYKKKEFAEALHDTSALLTQHVAKQYLVMAKVFNNPSKRNAHVFLYIYAAIPFELLNSLAAALRTHFRLRHGSIAIKGAEKNAQTLGWL